MNNFNYTGVWSIPNTDYKDLYGTLNFSQENGAELKITSKNLLPINRKFDIINGYANGKQITLKDCYIISGNEEFTRHNSFSNYSLIVGFIFVGVMFESIDEINFSSASYRFDGLELWLFKNHFNSEFDTNSEKIEYTYPSNIPVHSNDSMIIEFIFRREYSFAHFRKHSLEEKAYVNFTYHLERTWSDIWDDIFIFGNLLTLFFRVPQNHSDFVLKHQNKEIIVFFKRDISSNTWVSDVNNHLVLHSVKFTDVEDEFTNIVGKWFSNYENLKDIFDLYFGAIVNYRYPNQKFLNLMQFIEAFHRKTRTKIIDKIDEDIVREILEFSKNKNINKNVRKKISNRLEKEIEQPLKERFKHLYNECAISHMIFITDKIESLSNKLVNTRNYFTHYDTKPKDNIIKNHDINQMILNLENFVAYFMLLEVGFSSEKIKAIMQNRIGSSNINT